MKNTLAENMLRFGVKNLKETEIKTIEKLAEQASDTISDKDSSVTVTGATPSNTSNVTAADQLVKSGRKINGTIDETKSIVKNPGGIGAVWNVANKTLPAKHYLIIGDQKIIGDGGKSASLTIKFSDYMNSRVEACGNGIFAIGRLLNAFNNREISSNTTVVIGLNLATPNTIKIDINTGIQNALENFTTSTTSTLIGLDVISDSGLGNIGDIETGRNIKQKGTAGQLLSNTAVPRISVSNVREIWQKLRSIDSFDTSNFELKNANLEFSKGKQPIINAATKFVAIYQPLYIKALTNRFKSWINNQALQNKLDPNAFSVLNASLDAWAASQSVNIYSNEVKRRIDTLTKTYRDSTSGSVTGATATTKVTKGKEGSLQRRPQ